MKRVFAFGISLLMGGLLAVGSAFAGQAHSLGMDEGVVHSAKDLIGLKVMDQQGQEIGELQDFMIDFAQNEIAYGIVSVDGSPHIVPWSAISSPHEGPFLTLEADRETVTAAPGPPSPGQFDQDFGRQVHDHFGVSPYWEEDGVSTPKRHPGKRHPWQGLPGQQPLPPGGRPMGGS